MARLRVALWKRVAEKVRLIAAVNAIRTNAGFDTLGDADAAKREFARVSSASARLSLSRTTSRTSFAARNRDTSDCADQLRLVRAFSAQNGIGGSPVSTAAEATMTRRGPDAGHPMGESHRGVHSDSPSPLAFFDAAAGASGGAWRLGAGSAADAEEDPDANDDAARVRREVRNATATSAAAAAAAQLVLARLDAEDEDGDGGDGGRAAAEELATLLRRLAANAEMAAERVETAEGMRMRREGAMGMSA